MGLSTWGYTGYTFEELLEMRKENKAIEEFMNNLDVIIDGRFILEQKSFDIYFRGSRNQRIIDVKKSLKRKKIVLVEKYMKDKPIRKFRYENTHIANGVYV